MKKKLLSVLMAGALVVSSSVNAFAADKVINGSEIEEHTTNISITGDVQDQEGQTKPGTLQVTVPTAAAFTVDKNGALSGATIKIDNRGTQSVDVFAHGFTDVTPQSGITVVGKGNLADEDRTSVSLSIRGNGGTAYLGSAAGDQKSGIYSDENLATSVNTTNNPLKLATVASSNSENLTLEGSAGESGEAVDTAVKDNFTLILKIAKTVEK